MALTLLTKRIRRLHTVHAKIKALEAEEDGLKAFFRGEAGDSDAVFTDEKQGLEVPVTWKERSGWDSAALNTKLGSTAEQFKKVSRYAEVGCRKLVKEVA